MIRKRSKYTIAAATDPDRSANEKKVSKQSHLQAIFESVLATLVEFHKTQCFLATAVSVASLMILYPGSSRPVTWADQATLSIAGGIGILPVTFTYYVLALFNSKRKSWYIFGLSAISWTLGFAVSLSPKMISLLYISDNNSFYNGGVPDSCGGTSPLNLCVEPWERDIDIDMVYIFAYPSCVPMMIGLTIWQCKSNPNFAAKASRSSVKLFGSHSRRWFKAMHTLALITFAVNFLIFTSGIVMLFVQGAVNNDWKFGQIIALTLWLPTLIGGINNWVDGVDAASTKQLPSAFRTTRDSTNTG